MQESIESTLTNKIKNKQFWYEHIRQWESSELSQQTYCKQSGINHGTFSYWRSQYLLEQGKSKQASFCPVKIKESESASVKIKLASGTMVSIPLPVSLLEVAKLIRFLEGSDA